MTAALSRWGQAVSVYWSVNYDAAFTLARGGDIVRSFDPVLEAGPEGGGTGARLADEDGLGWDADPIASAGELQARLTGVTLTGEWLYGTAHPTVVVADE